MKRLMLMILALSMARSNLLGQEGDSTISTLLSKGLTFRAGIGSYALRDEFISRETYSGALPVYMLTWTDGAPARISQMSFELRAGSAIRNHNISASITEFAFSFDYLYPVGKFTFLSHDVSVYLGPSPDFFVHFRSQNIAKGGSAITRAYSVAMLFSAGAILTFLSPLNESLLADATFESNVLSFGGRIVNPDDSDESFVKPLTPFSGLRFKSDAGLRYEVSSRLHVRLSYRFELSRIDAWDYFISGSDMGVLSLHYRF